MLNADFPTPNSIFLRRSALEIQTVHPECLRDPPAGALEPFLLTACCFSNLPGTWLPPLPLLGPLSGKRSDSRLISFRSLLKCHFLREVIFTLSKIASPPSVQVERFRSLETELRSTCLSRPNISLPVSPQAHEHSANSPAFMRQASLGGPGHSHGRQGTEPRGLGGVVTWLLTGLPPEGRAPV